MAFPTVTTVLAALTGAGALPASMSNDPLHGGANASTLTATGMQAGSGGYGAAWYNTSSWTDVEGSLAIGVLPAVSAGNGVWLDAVQQPSGSVSTADGYQPEVTFGATNQIGMWRYDNAVGTRIGAATNLAANIAANDRLGVEVISTGTVNLYTKQSGTWALKQSVTTNLSTYYSAALFLGVEEFDTPRVLRVSDLQGGQTSGGTTPVTVTPSTPAAAFTTSATAQAATSVAPAAATASFTSTAPVTAATTVTASSPAVTFTATSAATATANLAATATASFTAAAAATAPTAVTPVPAAAVFGASAVVTTPASATASSRLPLAGVGT